MNLSLNELEALASKAARGAGYAWGPAQEAGKAARWLCARGVDGTAALARLLSQRDGAPYAASAPVLGSVWTAPGGALCPIATGCALSDHAETLPGSLEAQNVMWPILLAPFAGATAQHLGAVMHLTWEGAQLVTDGAALSLSRGSQTACAAVRLERRAMTALPAAKPACPRAQPEGQSLETLLRFAHRTYAPATEASRLTGAGAGLSDND